MDLRSLLKSGHSVALGVLALRAVQPALTLPMPTGGDSPPMGWTPMPDPADGGVGSPPFPVNLTAEERAHLEAFDVIAADDVRFRQLEIGRGIMPFGGATFRAPAQLGWGNAMRFLLTAEEFSAAEALRIGLVQEVVPAGAHVQRAATRALEEKLPAVSPGRRGTRGGSEPVATTRRG